MHTATNYYLFSLAISDLLLLVSGLPPDMYSIWYHYPYIFGEVFCVLQGFAAETSANATVLTITAFTVERYVAICHPFLSHTMSKLSRAIKYIMAIWIVAMILAVPQAMSFEIYHGNREDLCVCTVMQTVIPHAFGISTLLFFVTPMSLITILYVLIGLQLHKSTVGPSRGNSVRIKHRVVSRGTSTQPMIVLNGTLINPVGGDGIIGNGNGIGSMNGRLDREDAHVGVRLGGMNTIHPDEDGRKNFARNAQGTKHVVKMLVAVVVAFFICWAPFHAQRLFAVYSDSRSDNAISAYRILNYISGILYFLSTSINPLLYHIMSHKFREAFKDTFKGCLCRSRRSQGCRSYSTLSGRSSQINSHSNTDSCSRQSSLRYLEAEMARLHDSKRPLVVSFKRKKSAFPKRPKQVTILDAELQEALDSLNEETVRGDLFEKVRHYEVDPIKATSLELSREEVTELSYVEVHNLEPTHICPASGARCGEAGCCYLKKFERADKLAARGRGDDRGRHTRTRCKVTWNNELTKSSTMPHIVNGVELIDAEGGGGGGGSSSGCNHTGVTSLGAGGTKVGLEAGRNFLDTTHTSRRDERSNSCSQLECRSIRQVQQEMQIGAHQANESIIIPVT